MLSKAAGRFRFDDAAVVAKHWKFYRGQWASGCFNVKPERGHMKFKCLTIVTVVAGGVLNFGCSDKTPAPAPDTAAQVTDIQKASSKAAASDLIAQAQGLYDEAKEMIAKSDLKTARADVDQLNALRPQLPADWQAKVDEVTKLLASPKSK